MSAVDSPADGEGATGRRGRGRSLRRWRRLVAVSAAATFFLIVLGGVVRITGSGMGCGDDWPLCNGQLVPTMDLATFIEWSHRLVAAGVGLLVAGVAGSAWWPGRDGERWKPYRRISVAAAVLLVVQVLLGAVTVRLELPPASVMLHLGTAMLLLAVLIVGWARASSGRSRPRRDAAAWWSWAAAGFAFFVVLAGGFVANLDAAAACSGFPLCGGRLWPAGGWRVQVHWAHRALAYLLVLSLPALAVAVRARRPDDPSARRWTLAAALLAVAQLALGWAMVTGVFGTAIRALHVTLGTALFATLVAAAWTVARRPVDRAGPAAGGAG